MNIYEICLSNTSQEFIQLLNYKKFLDVVLLCKEASTKCLCNFYFTFKHKNCHAINRNNKTFCIVATEIYQVDLCLKKVNNKAFNLITLFLLFHSFCILENDIMTEELIRLALISKNITKRFIALLHFKDKQHCLLVSC